MKFPSNFPIKIIGNNNELFLTEIVDIICKYYPAIEKNSINTQTSKKSNYLAISALLYVYDQITIDALYKDLMQHPDTQMVL